MSILEEEEEEEKSRSNSRVRDTLATSWNRHFSTEKSYSTNFFPGGHFCSRTPSSPTVVLEPPSRRKSRIGMCYHAQNPHKMKGEREKRRPDAARRGGIASTRVLVPCSGSAESAIMLSSSFRRGIDVRLS